MPDGTLPAEDVPSLRGLMRRAAELERRGAIDAAAVVYRDVLRRFPGNARARAGLTAIEAAPPRLPRAGTAEHSAALAALVAASKARRHDEVIALAPALIEAYPDTALLHATFGAALSARGRGAEALRHLRHAFRLRPDHGECAYNLGVALQAMKRWSEAITAYAKAVERDPDNADAWNNLGAAFMALGDYSSAFTAFDRAIAVRPDLVEAWNNRGHARQNLGDIAGAIGDFEAALKRDPGHVKVYFNIGHALKLIGQSDGAKTCLWEVLKLDPTEARAARELASMATGDEAAALEKLVAGMLAPDAAPEPRMHAHYAAAYLDFEAERPESAMRHLSMAGEISKSLSGYRIEHDRAFFARLREGFSPGPEPLDAPPGDLKPVFVLGMPRSGTSLTEEILSRHSAVAAAGELEYLRRAVSDEGEAGFAPDATSLRRLRETYLGAIAAHAAPGKVCVTDKMPLNFRFIGHILTAMPEAVVVHLRRSPEAVCWSNYRLHFPARGMAFTSTQADIAAYYRLYAELMEFWEERFPGRIVHVDYEALTEDPEAAARALLGAVGLPWEDGVLAVEKSARSVRTASALQVKRGIYKGSSEAWRRYEPWLGEMLSVLRGGEGAP